MMQIKAEIEKNNSAAGDKGRWNCSLLRKFMTSTQGATAIEYALIAGGISVVVIVSGSVLGGNVEQLFITIQGAFE